MPDRCTRAVVSSWVLAIAEVGGKLAVQFKHHGLWCLYPGTTPLFYDMMLAWPSKGHFVREFLYKKQPYLIIPPPAACLPRQNCFNCQDPVPLHLKVAAAGFANGACLGCNLLNGSFVAVYGGPGGNYPCEWWGDFLDYCPGQEAVAWRVMKQSPTTWEAILQGEVSAGNLAQWDTVVAANVCDLPVTLTNSVALGGCTFPNTITLEAA